LSKNLNLGGMQVARPFYLAAQFVFRGVHLDIFWNDRETVGTISSPRFLAVKIRD
jgi:hypothetical protein